LVDAQIEEFFHAEPFWLEYSTIGPPRYAPWANLLRRPNIRPK
jgi:hypothetical protein